MPDDLDNNEKVNEDTAEPGSTPDGQAENGVVDEAAAAAEAEKAAADADAAAKEAEKAAAEVAAKEAADKAAADADAAAKEAEKAAAEVAAKETADKAAADAAAKEAADKATADAAAKEAADKAAAEAQKRDQTSSAEKNKIFTWLTVGQYVVLGAMGLIIVFYLFSGLLGENTGPFLFALSKPEVARGVITFLVAAGTVSLAVLLVMAAIMSSGSQQMGERFAFGKEVLTLLIGILGTIVGFYYGSAKEEAAALTLSPVALSEPAPTIGGKFTLDALVVGGAAPYTYSIKFNPPNIIPDAIDQQSSGPIHHEFTVPTDTGAKPDQTITFTMDVKDANGQSFTYNEDGKQSITLKAAAATPSSPSP